MSHMPYTDNELRQLERYYCSPQAEYARLSETFKPKRDWKKFWVDVFETYRELRKNHIAARYQ